MIGAELCCPFCQESKRVPFTAEGLQRATAAYVIHLVESHWDKLEQGREMRLATGLPVNDAWTRI